MNTSAAFWYQRLMEKYPIVSDDEWKLLDDMSKVKVFKKGESFVRFGRVARYAAFVLSGHFAYIILDEEGNEKIIRFAFADDLLANCESYNHRAPSYISITALEDSEVRIFSIKKLQPLYSIYMSLSAVNLKIYEEMVEQNIAHQQILSLNSPVKRYQFLLKYRPLIIKKISLTNIARFLFVSRESLSRARSMLFNKSD
ncbi:Crp/Fnr family transcriptional regulator [Desertivirga arenae]|uniref:Crp/Fnr family transcriptional regulator n=1 Tax=Desertivirga arenae TaxID=2810309 RepID=UPI001A96AB34|nr:Crp/Fnr family transcriptional regulator [Pedobacter sp. SYSU D00823]